MSVIVPSFQEETAHAQFLKQRIREQQLQLKSEFPTGIRRCKHWLYDPFGCGCPCETCSSERKPGARKECTHARTQASKIRYCVAVGFDKKLTANGKKQNVEADPESEVVTREEGLAAEWVWSRRVKNPHFVRGRKRYHKGAFCKPFLWKLASDYVIRESDKGHRVLVIYYHFRCGLSARNIAEELHCTEGQIQSQLRRLIARAKSMLKELEWRWLAKGGPRVVYDGAGNKIGFAHDPLGRDMQTPEGEAGREPIMYAGTPDDLALDKWQFEGRHSPEGLGVAEGLHPGLIAEAAEQAEFAETPATSAL